MTATRAFALALGTAAAAAARPVSVRVEWPDGRPAAGAEVVVYPVPEEVREARSACLDDAACTERALVARGAPSLRAPPPPVDRKVTGEAGAVLFEVPEGDHSVVARAGDLAAVEAMGGAHPLAVRIVLVPPRRFAVYAVSRETPLAGADVYAYTDRFLPLVRARTDAGGRAEVSGPYLYSAMVETSQGRAFVRSWETPVAVPPPRLCGVVLDAGEPAPGAVVRRGPGIFPINADADGRFCLDAFDEEETLWAQAGGLSTATTVALSAAQVTEATLHLDAGRRVEGRVVDEAGAPVAGAHVRVERAAAVEDDVEALLEAQVGADGTFAVEELPRVGLRLRARADGYATALERWEGKPVELRLRRLYPLTVMVRRRGSAVPEAWVQARALPGTPDAPGASGNADAEGRLHARLVAGRYAVVAGTSSAAARVRIPEIPELVLPARRRLVEIAVVRGGLPVEGAVVETTGEDPTEVGTSPEWGRVHVWTSPSATTFQVRQGAQLALVDVPAEEPGGAPVLVRAELPPLRKVKLTVTRDGKPAPGADVYLSPGEDEDAALRVAGVTGADGTFVAEAPDAESARLRALRPLDPGGPLRGEVAVGVGASSAAIALAPEGTEVLAVDDEGRPMGEVWLPRRGPVATRAGRVHVWVDEEEGGRPVARLRAPGMEPSTEVAEGGLRVRFAPCGYLVGSTETEDGRLVSAPVAFTVGEDEEPAATGSSSEEGTFRIGCVPAGDAVVSSPGFHAEAHVRVPRGAVGGPVRLRLYGASWLEVKTGEGAELTAYRVETDVADASATAGPDGTAQLGPLGEGVYDLRVEGKHGTLLRRVTVGPGAPTRLEVPDRAYPGRLEIVAPPEYEITNTVLEAIDGGGDPLRVGMTGEEGETVVSALPPGPRRIALRAKGPQGEASLSGSLYLGADTVRMRLVPVTPTVLELVPAE